ncbi:Tetratricopeptide repeat protein 1 [Hondaea fermentalgiana]|uniref:Hsp70-Hsp90 organising protein n=1 Tax=Hondaea fermentalgiana TaxID=2315210 RepID=A0A2R5H033_9STRA|nr:Tetratricopeptide repeat protein 1 [Hondaea fermentalgiana]|eukprot:GBG34403.1 Tetratricopeptide repeat protein 1 [Hondaea fermentalgiana]
MERDKAADAEDCKARGNEALKAKDFDKAIEWYTEAIKLAKNHVYFSNRSAAYLSKGFAETALKDAEECIALKPDWGKGYVRKGAALHNLKKYDESAAAYEKGLEFEPELAALKNGLEAVKQAKEQSTQSSGLFPPDFMDKIKASPKLSKYLEDPTFTQLLTMIQTNPQMLQIAAQDPRIQEVFSEILGIRFQTPQDDAEARAKAEEEAKERERKRKEQEAEEAKRKAEEEERLRREQETPEEREKRENKEKAEAIKLEGNEFYKRKEFDQALAKYNEAKELDPENMLFLLNIASVKLEQGELEACIEACDEAIKVGRSVYAPYEQVAKAYERKGNAYAKHKQWTKAIEEYKKGQLESSSPAVANKLKLAERKLKDEAAKSYLDPEKAAAAKEEGNVLFKEGKYPAAIEKYSEAIKRDPECAVYYGNRATAYMKLGDFGCAMDDCKKALSIDPKYVKCIAKKGNIEVFLKEYHKALRSFKQGLEIDANNTECIQGLQRTQMAIRTASPADDQLRASRAMEDPEIQGILNDPVMRRVLDDMRDNPSSTAEHMANPGIREKIETLIAAGILKTG